MAKYGDEGDWEKDLIERKSKGKMSREEAGRKGGEATAKTHDRNFYIEIGKKGGESRGRNYDNVRNLNYSGNGRKSEEANARNQDRVFYSEIGKKINKIKSREGDDDVRYVSKDSNEDYDY